MHHFPSPLGVSYFQIWMIKFLSNSKAIISVPSRGILFPNQIVNYCYTLGSGYFRPLSGYLISKWIEADVAPMDLILFPSPLGVSYFQISVVNLKGGRNMNNFRPLSGYLISKCFERIPIAKSTFNFRPLSGYLISKYCPPEPAILLAFLTLLRGKSFSCIFFLYLNIHNRLQMQYLCGARQNYLFF